MIESIRIYKEYKEYAKTAKNRLDSIIKDEASTEYQKFFSVPRNINYIGMSCLLSSYLCSLEKAPFESKKDITIILSALSRVADQLLEDKVISVEEFSYFNIENFSNHPQKKLVHTLAQKLYNFIPQDFSDRFSNLIFMFNRSQAICESLNPSMSPEEFMSIKNNGGGYSVLLGYCVLFPEQSDVNKKLTYTPYNTPSSIHQAIFNVGAWLQRFDDFTDIRQDGENGIMAKRLIRKKDLKSELAGICQGFETIYDKDKVKMILKNMEYGMFVNDVLLALNRIGIL